MAKKTNSSAQSSPQNPHARKPIQDPTQPPLSSQPQPLQVQPPPTSNSPRPNRSKKPTPVAAAAAAAAAAQSSKSSQRICFTSDDVLLILKSLSDFKSKTGKDPVKHLADFHDSLKSALRIKATERKLREKIRTLRIRFEKQCENGQDHVRFSSALEKQVFELSKKFWGRHNEDNELEDEDKNSAKILMLEEPPKKENAAKKPSISKKQMLVNAVKKPSTTSKELIRKEISSVFDSDKMGHLSFSGMCMGVNVLKRGMELIGVSEREELEKRWKKLKVQEAEVFLKRAELAVDQGRLILNELRSSS